MWSHNRRDNATARMQVNSPLSKFMGCGALNWCAWPNGIPALAWIWHSFLLCIEHDCVPPLWRARDLWLSFVISELRGACCMLEKDCRTCGASPLLAKLFRKALLKGYERAYANNGLYTASMVCTIHTSAVLTNSLNPVSASAASSGRRHPINTKSSPGKLACHSLTHWVRNLEFRLRMIYYTN